MLALAALLLIAPATAGGVTGAVPRVARCTKDTSYHPPGAADLPQPGLAEVIDPPHHYHVYGDTTTEILAQISECAPAAAADFSAIAKYWLNYSYLQGIQPDGKCRLRNVAVGIHAGVLLPAWTRAAGAAPGLAAHWQRYLKSLTAHEQGHIDRDIRWAQRLLADLRQLPELPCASVQARAAAVFNKDATALVDANAAYDRATDHGKTQGATL